MLDVASNLGIKSHGDIPLGRLVFACALPVLWVGAVALPVGYEPHFIGVASYEFRRVLNATTPLLASAAMVSYFAKLSLARGYVMLVLPSAAVLDLVIRYWLRKDFDRQWTQGECVNKVVAVGHASNHRPDCRASAGYLPRQPKALFAGMEQCLSAADGAGLRHAELETR